MVVLPVAFEQVTPGAVPALHLCEEPPAAPPPPPCLALQHRVESGMLSAFFTPMPDLSRHHLEAQLEAGVDIMCHGSDSGAGTKGAPPGLPMGCMHHGFRHRLPGATASPRLQHGGSAPAPFKANPELRKALDPS